MRNDVLELRLRVRRRTVAILVTAVLTAALLGGWWALSASADVEIGSSSSDGAGHADDCDYPDESLWAVFARDQDVAAVQTVRNDAPWPITVTSLRPDVFRFGALAADRRDDTIFPDPAAGAPPETETSDRVEIPPGREVAVWVVGPWEEPDVDMAYGAGSSRRLGVEHAPVRVRSLGMARETAVEFGRTLWISDLAQGSAEFQEELHALCAG